MADDGLAALLASRSDEEPIPQLAPPSPAADSANKAVSGCCTAPGMHSLVAANITAAKTDSGTPTNKGDVTETVQSDFAALAIDEDSSQQQEGGIPNLYTPARPHSPSQPPVANHALQVRLNEDPNLGFCVYALRRFKCGDVLYTERTAIEAIHHPDHRGIRNVYLYYSKMSQERRSALHGAFPVLAWANGVDAYEAAEGRTLIGSRITTRGFTLDICLTAEDHIRMRPDVPVLLRTRPSRRQLPEQAASTAATAVSTVRSKSKKTKSVFSELFRATTHPADGGSRSKSMSRIGGKSWSRKGFARGSDEDEGDEGDDAKSHRSFKSVSSRLSQRSSGASRSGHDRDKDWAQRETLKWFGRYAFRLKPGTAFLQSGADQAAAVYLLTDLINHRCSPCQNCRVQPKIGFISVIAERDIEVGEELTINYNKNKKDFDCRGECCQ